MSALDRTHDPKRRSWLASANVATDFPIQNLPLGVFRTAGTAPRGGVALGDRIVDLAALAGSGLVSGRGAEAAAAAAGPVLNPLLRMGNDASAALREQLSDLFAEHGGANDAAAACLVPQSEAELLLPVAIGSFTDFLCSIDHTRRMGNGTLPAAFRHLPIAYNSRATSVCVSGQAVTRPRGQFKAGESVRFGPEPWLDFELEVGTFVGPGSQLGAPIAIDGAAAQTFGFCLVNDWSARGIQFFESQPLGPFLSKSFATSISPWIVTTHALAPFRAPAAARSANEGAPAHLSSAADQRAGGIDLELEAYVQTARMRAAGAAPARVTATNFNVMYWTFAQMLTHHASNGCNLRTGDLLASGTTSGPTDESRACLAEITARGTAPVELPGGERRAWLEDGDDVIFRGRAVREGFVPIGFGECRAQIAPAVAWPEGAE